MFIIGWIICVILYVLLWWCKLFLKMVIGFLLSWFFIFCWFMWLIRLFVVLICLWLCWLVCVVNNYCFMGCVYWLVIFMLLVLLLILLCFILLVDWLMYYCLYGIIVVCCLMIWFVVLFMLILLLYIYCWVFMCVCLRSWNVMFGRVRLVLWYNFGWLIIKFMVWLFFWELFIVRWCWL